MTSKERIQRILAHRDVDRVGLFEVFWADTADRWAREGHYAKPAEKEDEFGAGRKFRPMAVEEHFGLDLQRCKALDLVADLDAGLVTVEENEETKLVRDGNGALLRWHKHHTGTPEHVDFAVKDRVAWQEQIRPRLLRQADYRRRIDFNLYRQMKQHCDEKNLFLTCGVVGAFDLISPMCGHEYLLMGIVDDPDWVRDMCDVYARLTVELLERLFAEEGLPDGLWAWDDLGFKGKPFISPHMYRDIVQPAHKRVFDFAHSHGLKVILHSCGYVEPLVPGFLEAGVDCLQPLEVKAGMDLLKIKKQYGDRLALMGGMDARALVTNDKAVVERELQNKLPGAMAGGGYVLQVDHSVPSQVDYETYDFFARRGLEIGTY
jgi:uroporphyrinogen decarboxylase